MAELIWVEVVLALQDMQYLRRFQISKGSCAMDAITQSNLAEEFPQYFQNELILGIFSKKINKETILSNNDRIEIYRPLLIDPKENRRLRSRKKNESY